MADNLLSRLGRSAGAAAKTTTGASSLGQALARSAPTPQHTAPAPTPIRQTGMAAAAPMRELAAAAPFMVDTLRQQAPEPEPWVSMVNEDDPSDLLYMPRSVAENAPDNYVVSRQLDPNESLLRASEQEALNIYNQPEQIQAAFGIGSQSTPQPPSGDLRPYDAGQINPNYGQPGQPPTVMPTGAVPVADSAGNRITPSLSEAAGFNFFNTARAAREVAPSESDSPWWRDVLDAGDDILDTEIPGTDRTVRDVIDFAAGTATPGYNADATGDGTDVVGPFLPGTNIPVNVAAGQAREAAGSAGGVWTDIISDIINADPGQWWETEVLPAIASYGEAIDAILGRDEYADATGKERGLGSLGEAMSAFGGGIRAALPESLEEIPETFLSILQMPQDWTTAQRTRIMMAAINGEADSLNAAEQEYAARMYGMVPYMDDLKDLPFGLGWIAEKGENVLPIDYEMWIIRNPDKANAALEQGGPQAVFDAYVDDTTSDSALGAGSSIVKQTQNDPLTYLPVGGLAGQAVKRAGRGIRMAESAGPARRAVGSTVETAGDIIYGASRGAEITADMGLELLLDGISQATTRAGITAPSSSSRRAAEMDEVFTPMAGHMQQEVRRTPDGRPIGPDPGGEIETGRAPVTPDAGDVARARDDAEARGIGADPGGDVARSRTPRDPEPMTPEQAEERVRRAQERPEPPADGPDAADNVEYAPGVIIRRTVDEESGEVRWQVDASPDEGRTREVIDSGSWENALADAEEVRRRFGIPEADINLEPPRWTANAATGQRVIDDIIRNLPNENAQRALRRQMEDDWVESVERQRAIKAGGDPIPDHAIETSRITYATAQAARNQLPGGWSPTFEGGRTPRAERTPYHDAEATIHTPRWEDSTANRENLYRTSQIKARISKNPSNTQLEQARRYVDLVNEHEKWFPDDPSPGWADAKANRDAILNHPRFRQHRNQLISEGHLPGSRTTRRMRSQREAEAEADIQRQRDAEIDPRYELVDVERDGTIIYRIDDDHLAYIDPELRRGRPVNFSGHIERNGTDVTGTLENPSQAALLDELVERAGLEPAARTDVTPDPGDVTRTADDLTPQADDATPQARDTTPTPEERMREAELAEEDPEGARQFLRDLDESPDAGDAARAADTTETPSQAPDTEPVRAEPGDEVTPIGEVDPDTPPGTQTFRDKLVEEPDPADTPKPVETLPPQVNQVPRIMGEQNRPVPEVQRSMKIDGSDNDGWLFRRPLERGLEKALGSFRFEATGQNLYQRLNQLEYEFRTGKSKLHREEAELAAIKQVKAEMEAELKLRYPDREPPIGLRTAVRVFDGINQHFRERALASWWKAARYPSLQLFGNAAIAAWMGRPQWVLDYLRTFGGARREILARSRIGRVQQLETGRFKAEWNEGRFLSDPKSRTFKTEQEAWDFLAERQFQKRTKYLQKKMKIATTRATAKQVADPNNLGPMGKRAMKRWDRHRAELIAWADATGDPNLWKHDPGLSTYGKKNAALGTRQGKTTILAYEQFHGHPDDFLMVEKAFRKMHMDTVGRYAGGLSGNKAILRWGEYWDIAWRETIGEKVMDLKVREHTQDYRNYAIGRMQEWGLSEDDARAAWRAFQDNPDTGFAGYFSANDVYKHFRTYLEEGQATRLQRDWQSRVNQITKEREAEIKRLSFASDETNLDTVLKRTLFLHYFFSRQTWMFGHQMARHPFMINLAISTWDEMGEYIAENEGFIPDWAKGWMNMFGLPGGRTLMMNPLYLVSTWMLFNDQGERSPMDMIRQIVTGESDDEFGGNRLDALDELFGLAPVIDTVTNLLGYRDDAWKPDVLGYGLDFRNLTLLINTAKTFGWLDGPMVRNVYDDMNEELRDFLSGLGLPGTEHHEAVGSINAMEREINAIAIDEAQKQGLDPLNDPDDYDWVMQQMQDPDSELYQTAQRRWIIGEVAEVTAQTLAGPLGPRTRLAEESSDETSADGTKPDLIESIGDSENGWDLLNRTDPAAKNLTAQKHAYDNIGTEKQQVAARVYNDVVYGELWYPVEVDGVTYSAQQVNAMTEDQRKKMGQALLQQYGLLDDVQDYWDERSAFRAQEENREFATYHTWAGEVRDYEGGDGGVEAYWQELMSDEANVDARRYYESVEQQNLSPEIRLVALTSIDAYMAAKGIQIHAYYPRPDGGGQDPLGIFDGPQRPQEASEGGSPMHQELRVEGPKFAQKMVAWDTAVQAKMQEWGYAPGTNFADLPTADRIAIEDAVKDEGTFEPNYNDMPNSVRYYIEWAAQQPEGADTSIEAYIAWDEANYNTKAGQRFRDSLSAVPDEEALSHLPSLYYQHNHKAGGSGSSGSGSGSSGGSSGGSSDSGMGSFDWMFGG